MPPRVVRRLLLGPLVLLLTAWLLLSLPLVLLVAMALTPVVPGRWRPLRFLLFVVAYLVMESVGLLVAFVLWIASGFGVYLHRPAFQRAHYRVLKVLLGSLVRVSLMIFKVGIHVDEIDLHATDGTGRPPIVVLARHAGPGDSFLLVAQLLHRGWHPRVVLKESLQWDPLLDVMLGRLPCRFIPSTGPGRRESLAAIAELSASMGPDDALLIFPEGGNFTETRRTRSIAKLEELGMQEEADMARAMRHVLAPRTAGSLAAINARPDAEVVLVAHTGLEDLSTLVDLWRGLPMDADVMAKAWRTYPDDIPDEAEEQKDWLFRWWVDVDSWIVRQRGVHFVPDAIATRVRGGYKPSDFDFSDEIIAG